MSDPIERNIHVTYSPAQAAQVDAALVRQVDQLEENWAFTANKSNRLALEAAKCALQQLRERMERLPKLPGKPIGAGPLVPQDFMFPGGTPSDRLLLDSGAPDPAVPVARQGLASVASVFLAHQDSLTESHLDEIVSWAYMLHERRRASEQANKD